MKITFAASVPEMQDLIAARVNSGAFVDYFTESTNHGTMWKPIFYVSITGEGTDEKIIFNEMSSGGSRLKRRDASTLGSDICTLAFNHRAQ